jgi:hypothetical protein
MPLPAPVRPPARVWAGGLVLLVLVSCGRVGYDRVGLLDGSPGDTTRDAASPDRFPLDTLSPDTAPVDTRADTAPVDTRPPDGPAPLDVGVDRPPDLAPDTAIPPPVPPAFVRAGSAVGGLDAQLSFMFDAGNGLDRYLVVGIAIETETRSVTAVSFDGRALVRLGAHTAGHCATFLYGLPNPPAGSQTLAVSLSASSDLVVMAASFTGVRQTTGQDGFWSASAAEGDISLVVPSAPGDHVVDTVCLDQATGSPRVGPGQTERGRQAASTFGAAMSSEVGAASVTMSWTTAGATGGWSSGAVSLKPAAAMAVRLQRRQLFAWRSGYPNTPGSGPVVSSPKRSAAPPNRL